MGNYTKTVKAEQYRHPDQMELVKVCPCVGTHAHFADDDRMQIRDGDYVVKNSDGSLEVVAKEAFKRQYESIDCSCDKCLGVDKKAPVDLQPATGLLARCKEILLKMKEDGDYISPQYVAYELEFSSLPKIVEDGEDVEDLDFENFELMDITDSSMTIWAGGDWQEPLEFTAIHSADGKLHYTGGAIPGGPKDGMSTREFIKRVFGTENPPELEGADIADY